MEDYIVFGSSSEIVSMIFYSLGIILPTFMVLINIGHLVYTIGEYKESDKTIPLIILLLSMKLFIIIFAMFIIYHTIFDFKIQEVSLTSVILFLWGIMLSCDASISHRLLSVINKYSENVCFKQHIIEGFTLIITKKPYAFWGNILTIIGLILCIGLSIFMKVSETIYLLELLFPIYFWIIYKISKYFKRITESIK